MEPNDTQDFSFDNESNPFENKTQQRPQYEQNNYQQRQGGYNGGSYQSNKPSYNQGGNYQRNNYGGQNKPSWQGGNKSGGFQRKELTPEELKEIKLYIPFAITGNTNANEHVVGAVARVVRMLEAKNWTTRTGGMDGIDDVAEKASHKPELHIPWKGFNQKQNFASSFNTQEAIEFARRFQPNFDTLKPAHQGFLAKNVRLLLGKDLKSRVACLIIWSEDGAELPSERSSKTGAAGHLIALAYELNIPVFNLGKPGTESRIEAFATRQQ